MRVIQTIFEEFEKVRIPAKGITGTLIDIFIEDDGVKYYTVENEKSDSGTYIAGKDIPAGSYIYTCLASGEDWGNVTIYSEKGEGDQLFWEVVAAPEDGEEPESFFITLNPDDQLKSGVPFSLTIYAGVSFK